MSLVEAARVTCEMADGGFSHALDRGRFVTASFARADQSGILTDRGGFLELDTTVPDDSQIPNWTEAQRVAVEGIGWGAVWEESLKAVILPWVIRYRDADLTFWDGPEWGTGSQAWRHWPQRPTAQGQWRIIRPAGGVSFWQQYDASLGDFAKTSAGSLLANPCFCVSLYREAVPKADDSETVENSSAPYIYTGFSFGGQWHLRFPKLRPAELYKLVGGQWQLVDRKDWQASELYSDSAGAKELYAIVMCLEGKLLIKASSQGEGWVYSDPSGRAINVAAAPVTFSGNGGAAYYGLHEIAFAASGWNVLLARDPMTLDKTPLALPASVTVGSKPAGTYARCYAADGRGEALTSPARTFFTGLALWSEDGTRTPVVKLAGLNVNPRTMAGPQAFVDVTADFVSVEGGYRFDFETRMATSRWTVVLDNARSQYSQLAGNKLMRLVIGRGQGAQEAMFTCIAALEEDAIQSVSDETATFPLLDRMEALDSIDVGDREPLDGLTVAQGIRKVLSWGDVREAEIAELYDSGRRLPGSSFALQWALETSGDVVTSAVDVESGAACKLRRDLSLKRALQYLMRFDYNAWMYWDRQGMLRYRRPSATIIRNFRETESPAAEDEIRRQISHRPRLSEGYTSVEVGGRDRGNGRPLCARACDYPALNQAGSGRFRGVDKTKRVSDENLNLARIVQERCRYAFEWSRRLRNEVTFEAIGQLLEPLAGISVTDRTGSRGWFVLNTHERADREGAWDLALEAVRF